MNGNTVVIAANGGDKSIFACVKIDIHPNPWRQVAPNAIRPDRFWNLWLFPAIGGFVTLCAGLRPGVLFALFMGFVGIVAGGACQGFVFLEAFALSESLDLVCDMIVFGVFGVDRFKSLIEWLPGAVGERRSDLPDRVTVTLRANVELAFSRECCGCDNFRA